MRRTVVVGSEVHYVDSVPYRTEGRATSGRVVFYYHTEDPKRDYMDDCRDGETYHHEFIDRR